MLSTFPAMMSADGLFGNPFPAFEGGFTPWDCQEPPFVFSHHDEPEHEPIPILKPESEPVLCPVLQMERQEPVISNSSSDNSNPIPVDSNSGSDEPNRKHKNSSRSCSDDTNPPVDSVIDDRKRRRMISNRESARRSRMRKQKHLENLRNQVNRLRVGNREIMNQLRLVTHHCQFVQSENDRLRSESVILRQRLWDIRQVLLVRQLQQQLSSSAWPCNNFTSINEETIPQSLIT